jgi:D-alanyl-D-alanine carboxypeptidase
MNPHLAATCQALGISTESLAARALPEYEEAQFLEVAETRLDGSAHLLVPAAGAAWKAMKATAEGDGVKLFIVSAFRSIERQVGIVQRKLDAGLDIDEILSVCAPPGFSEHHSGRAVDISTPGTLALETVFETTPAFAWLTKRAFDFDFYLSYPKGNPWCYQYEPWHWCYCNRNFIA